MAKEKPRRGGGGTFEEVLYGDMLMHTLAMRGLVVGRPLDHALNAYLGEYSCNSLNSPNITEWESFVLEGRSLLPVVLSPESPAHVVWLSATRKAFERIHWKQARLYLGGEEGLKVHAPYSRIRKAELPFYFKKAEEQGLFHLESPPKELEGFGPTFSALILPLRDYGFKPGDVQGDAIVERYWEVKEDPRFKDELFAANVRKVGCFLAVADQYTYEMKKKRRPLDPNYKPSYIWQPLEEFYRDEYGREMPGLHKAYQEAHKLFVSLRRENKNPLAQHLINKRVLPAFT